MAKLLVFSWLALIFWVGPAFGSMRSEFGVAAPVDTDLYGMELAPSPEKTQVWSDTLLEQMVPEQIGNVAEEFGFDLERMGLFTELYIYKTILTSMQASGESDLGKSAMVVPAPAMVAYESWVWYKAFKSGKGTGVKRVVPPRVWNLWAKDFTPRFAREKIMATIEQLKFAHQYMKETFPGALKAAVEKDMTNLKAELVSSKEALNGSLTDNQSRIIRGYVSELEGKLGALAGGDSARAGTPEVSKVLATKDKYLGILKMEKTKKTALTIARLGSKGLRGVTRFSVGLSKVGVTAVFPVVAASWLGIEGHWIYLKFKDGQSKEDTMSHFLDIVSEIEGQLGIYE